MPRLDPRTDILPQAQQEIWPLLAPAPRLSLVLYGGTAALETNDSTLLVASLEDLLATKLKAILDRAEAKDYRDIAAMLSAGVSLERGLGAFAKMYRKDPGLPLRAIGFFKDGDLPLLPKSDQDVLRAARDRVSEIPDITLSQGSLAGR